MTFRPILAGAFCAARTSFVLAQKTQEIPWLHPDGTMHTYRGLLQRQRGSFDGYTGVGMISNTVVVEIDP